MTPRHISILFLLFGALSLTAFSISAATKNKSDDDYYEFTPAWNQPLSLPFVLPFDHKGPAGNSGYLLAKDESMVFEGSPKERERFWGMAVYVSKDFPPKNKDDARAVVERIASFGFNLVRIAGIDTPRFGLYENWKSTGSLQSPTMDRLDNFVAELRRAGIYYALTINDSPLKAAGLKGIDKNGHEVKEKRYKHVQLYEEKVIQDTLDWYRAFFEHLNPYTKLTYSKDPANIYVTAVGEDSIYDGYFWKDSAYLSQKNIAYLQTKFNEYLLDKYGNDKALKKSWDGLSWRESLKKENVEFHLADDLDDIDPGRRRDIMQFLYQIDYEYALRVKNELDKTGYRGLFSVTNGWYGFGNRRLNEQLGDFMDIHGYFDHPIRAKRKGGYYELLRNTEHLAAPGQAGEKIVPFKRNFYKYFTSAQKGKPLLISEWNHSAFSDFAYEGPLLITAYGALQGYSGLTIHTYLSFDLSYQENYANRNLTGGANPVLMSLSPSLALAYRNGYISEANTTRNIVVAESESEFWDEASRTKMNWPWGIYKPYINDGFESKVRTTLIHKGGPKLEPKPKQDHWLADTKEILWDYSDNSGSVLTIDTPRFLAVAGRLKNKIRLAGIELTLDDPAALTIVSLDDNDVSRSGSLFITAVSSYQNHGQEKEYGIRQGGQKNLVKISKPGTAPLFMKYVKGELSFRSHRTTRPKVYGVALDGTLLEVKNVSSSIHEGGSLVSFPLGTVNTPWYWLKYE